MSPPISSLETGDQIVGAQSLCLDIPVARYVGIWVVITNGAVISRRTRTHREARAAHAVATLGVIAVDAHHTPSFSPVTFGQRSEPRFDVIEANNESTPDAQPALMAPAVYAPALRDRRSDRR